MDLPLDENRGRLSYWLFYVQRCVTYAYAEVLRAHCEERGKPYVITPPQWGALSLLLVQDGMTIGTMSQNRPAPQGCGVAPKTCWTTFSTLARGGALLQRVIQMSIEPIVYNFRTAGVYDGSCYREDYRSS